MAPHSSTFAWKIPWMEEPGRLQSMGSLGVGHNWVTSLSLFTFMHWRRKWQSIPVFLPGESQGWGSLMGCHLWGHTELDTTEATWRQQQHTGVRLPWCLKGKESTDQCRKGGFDPWVKKERATHFSILAWEIPWIEGSGLLQSHGVATKQQQ